MEYPLTIASLIETSRNGEQLRSPLTCVMAEADLGPFAHFGSPEFFFGKLVGVSENMIQYFKNSPEVEVRFRGARYNFEALGLSGSFKLIRTS